MDAFVLQVDKPIGPTSHDIVQQVRRALRIRRVGHTGTLDPFASGLLVVCVGWTTRLAEHLVGLPKTYRARMRLGVATTTDDHTGEVVSHGDTAGITPADVENALQAEVGRRLQRPPAYSAKRIDGRRAHALARAGQAVDLAPVEVRVDEISMRSFAGDEVEFEVTCGKGTFVRAIARDVGERLGAGACLTALRRTQVGHFHVDDAVTPEDLGDPARVAEAAVDPASAVDHLPSRVASGEEAARVRTGGRIPGGGGRPGSEVIAILGEDRTLLAVGEERDGWIQPRKVFG